MRGFPALAKSQSHRVRRCDALVLGGALPGLVASIALARRGCRVVILEDSRAARSYAGLREPFHLCSADTDGILGTVLRGLGLPLIDQRRFQPPPEPLQVVTPNARIRLSAAAEGATELARWGLAQEDTSRALLESLEVAGKLARDALMDAEIVHAGRRRPFAKKRGPDARNQRGLPDSLAGVGATLQKLCTTLVGALGNQGATEVSGQAASRLIASALETPVTLLGEQEGLRGMLQRRAEALHVERRQIEGSLQLVSVAGQPSLESRGSDVVWTGRALILNAPRSTLREAFEGELPGFLSKEPCRQRRHIAHFHAPREQLPDGMGDRLIVVHPASEAGGQDKWVRVRVHPGARGIAEIVVSADAPMDVDLSEVLERSVRDLLPFSEDCLEAQRLPEMSWDSDLWLPAQKQNGGWPRVCELRVSNRPTVYSLERNALAALGSEGDLLLGWRGGDAIAAELR